MKDKKDPYLGVDVNDLLNESSSSEDSDSNYKTQ